MAKKQNSFDLGKLFPNLMLRLEEELGAYTNMNVPLVEKAGETLTANMRALRLALNVSDQLLSMGVAANDVTYRALEITETYCDRAVHIDIISNLIMVSQLRGVEREPLTLIRPVAVRTVNNMSVQRIQQLVHDIAIGKYTLNQAEDRLEYILKHPVKYPAWVISVSNAAIASGVAVFFTTNWRVLPVTFAIGLFVDRVLHVLAKRLVPGFFRQVAAAIFIVLLAAIVAQLDRQGVTFFDGMNPTLIVVGGVIMLLSGLAFVSAIQDAIQEYYLTATAGLLRVAMQTSGIVVGILIGLYMARKLGIGIAVSPNPLTLTALPFQIAAGAFIAGVFGVATQMRRRAIFWSALLGAGAVFILYAARNWGIYVVAATGVAAIFVGALATAFSRLWRTPTSGTIAAGIIPLVPGLALYNGLMQLVNYPPGDPNFNSSLGTLFAAVATAIAIAAGASFGHILFQPINQQNTLARNLVPFTRYMRQQLKRDRQRRASAKSEQNEI